MNRKPATESEGFVPVSERLPEKMEEVLAIGRMKNFGPRKFREILVKDVGKDSVLFVHNGVVAEITHWKRLSEK